ncbi:hypothetical protein CDL12_17976 [Handroanthus impetiginosus]|uniref:Uncharacterized protein n=1 Tax=Handroanthus impetiginosus TaxID=429701 RepID=A0A2G9GVY5_9LAMI|nr:hypothetical protein CDL12_17976 [Handroanthus impetiginosus]
MAHHQSDHLLKIGIEGFAIIDEYFPKRGAKTHIPQKSRAPRSESCFSYSKERASTNQLQLQHLSATRTSCFSSN